MQDRATSAGTIPDTNAVVAKSGGIRSWALVAFGAGTGRPTIVCLPEDAMPASPGPDWLVLARESDVLRRALSPPQPPETKPPENASGR